MTEQETIARTIFQQLGGHRFKVMTGARDFYWLDRGLQFGLPRGAKDGINKVRIELTAADDYTVTFYRSRSGKVTQMAQVASIYFDQLQELFERYTGLYVSLGPIKVAGRAS